MEAASSRFSETNPSAHPTTSTPSIASTPLIASTHPITLTRRATNALRELTEAHDWLPSTGTVIHRTPEHLNWHTYAGQLTNTRLSQALPDLIDTTRPPNNLTIPLNPNTSEAQVHERLQALANTTNAATPPLLPLDPEAITDLKFHNCLPQALTETLLRERLTDETAYRTTVNAPVTFVG